MSSRNGIRWSFSIGVWPQPTSQRTWIVPCSKLAGGSVAEGEFADGVFDDDGELVPAVGERQRLLGSGFGSRPSGSRKRSGLCAENATTASAVRLPIRLLVSLLNFSSTP